jgi:hypothetical protein
MTEIRPIQPDCGPTFILIGAARSGTTALFRYLEQHPGIGVSNPKEPHYFALSGSRPSFTGPGDAATINKFAVTDPEAYENIFDASTVRGEASVSYLYYPDVAERVRSELPDTRIICQLRNPVDRAYSAYTFMRTRDFEPLDSFAAALEAEEARREEGWHHIWHYDAMSRYAGQFERWMLAFPPEQILLLTYDEFQADPEQTIAKCFEFLGVDPAFQPPSTPTPHFSGEPRSRFRHTLARVLPNSAVDRVRAAVERRNIQRVRLDPALRSELTDRFRADVTRLEQLTGRDLSHWYTQARD